MSKKFKLSAVLYGHSLDVRSVCTSRDNSILSGSRDKTAKFWRSNGINTGYSEVMTYKDQKNFVIAVLYLEPTEEHTDGLIITGGNDNIIYIYKPSEPFASITLKEHTNAVSCLSKGTNPKTFLSGSWDSTAKLWNIDRAPNSLVTLKGHSAAVWSIFQLEDLRICTASADKTIAMWNQDGQRLATLKGHSDCVRGLADFPESNTFISVSNDATIKVWTYGGENIETYYGHTNYIYSIARCKSGGEQCFVTSDEDRTVRYWLNGTNVESFQIPAQSVWSVACTSSGDIVTASSDGVIRVFTQDEAKYADDATLNQFNEEVEALMKQSLQEIGGYKVSDLPGKEALYDPGKKPGQMKMIRENDGVVAYTWVEDGDNSHWDKVGEVLGGTDKDKQNKTVFEGKSYDFVFSVDVEDGKPPLKLPFNRGQDTYQAANEFLARNFLPSSYLEQVVDFILKNTKEKVLPASNDYVDPFTGASRYTPGSGGSNRNFSGTNPDPFTGADSYSTSAGPKPAPINYTSQSYFPVTSYKTFEMGDPDVILGKLKEFNQKLVDDRCKVTDCDLDNLIKICNGPPDDPNSFDVLFKLLDWPDEVLFPVIDVVRMSVRDGKNNEIISGANQGVIATKLISFVSETCKIQNNLIVALRTLCNLFTHDFGEDLVFHHRFDLVENMTALSTLNKNGQIALATLLLNLSVASLKKHDDLSLTVLAEVIPDILTNLHDSEAQFRSYVALGNLLSCGNPQEIKAAIVRNTGFVDVLQLHLLGGQNEVEIKKRNCAKQVHNLLY